MLVVLSFACFLLVCGEAIRRGIIAIRHYLPSHLGKRLPRLTVEGGDAVDEAPAPCSFAGARSRIALMALALGLFACGLPASAFVGNWLVPLKIEQRVLWTWASLDTDQMIIVEAISASPVWIIPAMAQLDGPAPMQAASMALYVGTAYPETTAVARWHAAVDGEGTLLITTDDQAELTESLRKSVSADPAAGDHYSDGPSALVGDILATIRELGQEGAWTSWRRERNSMSDWYRRDHLFQARLGPTHVWRVDLEALVEGRLVARTVVMCIYAVAVVVVVMRGCRSAEV